jgi:hypothetical protein
MKTFNPDIEQFLIDAHEDILDLVLPYTDLLKENLAKENPVFHEEIAKQYLQQVKSIMHAELAKNTGVDSLTIMECLENFDIAEYLQI